jgi:PAS domain S-box-containing protein
MAVRRDNARGMTKSKGQKTAENDISAARKAGGPFVTASDRIRMPMVFSDPNLPGNPIVYANKSFLSLTGYDRDDVLGQSSDFLMGPETDPDARAQIEASFSGGFYEGHTEIRYYRKDRSSFWAVVFNGPVLDVHGTVTHHFVSFLDVTRRRQEERRLKLLLNELSHRTQNTLATVQAIALQTLHGVADEHAVELFESRLLALSEAHRLLGSDNWEGAGLREVITSIVEPFRLEDARKERFSIEGGDVRLRPKTALTFAMVFQELATNAAKYGALTNGVGCVRIAWRREASSNGDRLRLSWAESGGPRVDPPTRSGFGADLIKGGLAKELKGTVRLDYEPDGAVCEILMPFPPQERKEPCHG